MALALNNLKRVDMPLNKETKPSSFCVRLRTFWMTFVVYGMDDLHTGFNKARFSLVVSKGIPNLVNYLMPNSDCIYIYIYHYHVMLRARISLTLTHHPCRSSSWSSRPHSVSVLNFCWLVPVGRPILARLCEGVHSRTSLMSSSLFLQQCPTCLVRLIRMVFEMGGWWPYSCCFVWCCFLNLFHIARSTLVQLPSIFFSIHLVNV